LLFHEYDGCFRCSRDAMLACSNTLARLLAHLAAVTSLPLLSPPLLHVCIVAIIALAVVCECADVCEARSNP